MRKYLVEIPKPSAKRLENDRRFVAECFYACWGSEKKEYPIEPGVDVFEYDGPDKFRDFPEEVLDAGWQYEFYVEYRNSTGSRIERRTVVPIPIDN